MPPPDTGRQVRLLLVAGAASRVGDSLSSVALAVVVYDLTHSPAWVAVCAVAKIVPSLLFGPAGGAAAERYGLRRVMVASDLAGAAVLLATAALVAGGAPVVVVVAAAAAASLTGVAFRPAQATLTPRLCGPDRLAGVNAALAAIDNVSLVVGPATAAVIVALGSPSAAFVFDGATFLVSAACLAAMGPTARSRPGADRLAARRAARPAAGGGRRPGVRGAVTQSPDIPVLVAAIAAATLVYGIECVLLIVLAEDRLGMGSGGVGPLYAAMGTGGLVAARLAARLAGPPRLASGPGTVVPVSLAAAGVPVILLATTHSPGVACVLLAWDGAATVVLEVAVITSFQRTLAPEVMAGVMGSMNAVVAGSFLTGFVLAPALVATVGVGGALVAAGCLLPATAVVLHRYRPRAGIALAPTIGG